MAEEESVGDRIAQTEGQLKVIIAKASEFPSLGDIVSSVEDYFGRQSQEVPDIDRLAELEALLHTVLRSLETTSDLSDVLFALSAPRTQATAAAAGVEAAPPERGIPEGKPVTKKKKKKIAKKKKNKKNVAVDPKGKAKGTQKKGKKAPVPDDVPPLSEEALVEVKVAVQALKDAANGIGDVRAACGRVCELALRAPAVIGELSLKRAGGLPPLLKIVEQLAGDGATNSNRDECVAACHALEAIVVVIPRGGRRVANAGASKVLVAVLKGDLDKDLLSSVCHVLAACAKTDKQVPLLVRVNGLLPIVIGWMETYRAEADVIVRILALLRALLKSEANVAQLGKSGVVPPLIKCVETHQDRPKVLTVALGVVAKMCTEASMAHQCCSEGAVELAVEALRPKDEKRPPPSVVKPALAVLNGAVVTKEGRKLFMACDGLRTVGEFFDLAYEGPLDVTLVTLATILISRWQTAEPLPVGPPYFESIDVQKLVEGEVPPIVDAMAESSQTQPNDKPNGSSEGAGRKKKKKKLKRSGKSAPLKLSFGAAEAIKKLPVEEEDEDMAPFLRERTMARPEDWELEPPAVKEVVMARTSGGRGAPHAVPCTAAPVEYSVPDPSLPEVLLRRTLRKATADPYTPAVVYDRSCPQSSEEQAAGGGENALIFDSRFESGNLSRALRTGEAEYDLILQPDINTVGHIQWFYFSVRNMSASRPYTINIINQEKATSQFQQGMRPVFLSMKSGKGWTRLGRRVHYSRNQYARLHDTSRSFCTLSFEVQVPHDDDTVFFAYHFPYTWTRQEAELRRHCAAVGAENKLRVQTLCQSLSNNPVRLLTITDFTNLEELQQREYVVYSARVHPGESNASWMLHGLLEQLLADDDVGQALRARYIFKIIPMLNPDGVCNGHHRTALLGVDLNREYLCPSPLLTPSIYCSKQLVKTLVQKGSPPVLFCDLHGHSKKKDVFIYGCGTNEHVEKVVPALLDEDVSFFSYASGSFKVQKSKEGCGRIVMHKLGVARSYTLESSYCGPTPSEDGEDGLHFTPGDLVLMGRSLAAVMLEGVGHPRGDAVLTAIQATHEQGKDDKDETDESEEGSGVAESPDIVLAVDGDNAGGAFGDDDDPVSGLMWFQA